MAEPSLPTFDDAVSSRPNELIVASEHLEFVQQVIGAGRTIAESRSLDLVHLEVAVDEATARLQTALGVTTLAGNAADPLGVVTRNLRVYAARQHGGWTPTVGRNRTVVLPGAGPLGATGKTSYGTERGGVGATGKTSYGGGGAPSEVSEMAWNPPPARQLGPGAGVRIGLVDTKVWPHPWLSGACEALPGALLPDGAVEGLVPEHGTFVAGLILSQAPGASIVVRPALDQDGTGSTWQAAEAIADLGRSGVSVINLSFSCYTDDGQPPLVLARAVDRVNADVVLVAAAGNHAALRTPEGEQTAELDRLSALPSWPAALDDVIAVGALDGAGGPADFSPVRPWVDLAVRGTDLRSTTVPRGGHPGRFRRGWAEWSGTSFAAALVSGAIAARTVPGRISAAEVAAGLLATGTRPTVIGSGVPGSPRHVALRTAGWARTSRALFG